MLVSGADGHDVGEVGPAVRTGAVAVVNSERACSS